MSVSAPARRAKLLGTLFCTLTALACGPAPESGSPEQQPALNESNAPVVYGNDDRMEVYAHPSATLQDRARQSTVALLTPDFIDDSNPNNIIVDQTPLSEWEGLCTDQRFYNDPAPAFCSGTLIDDDLVLTAGHCVTSAAECADTRFVFKFYKTSENTLETITSQDVFSCKSIVVRRQSSNSAGDLDYAIIRMDRSAAPRFTPAPVRAGNTAMTVGQNVAVIGSGSGLPVKIDSGGSVRAVNSGLKDYFVATTDTFAGNSGSAVYETATNTIAGILVRGDEDYVLRSGQGCYEVNVCSETGCGGEEITYVNQAITAFCAANTNVRLCNTTPPPATNYVFTASNTSSATRSTINGTVTLKAGDKLTVGTCGVTGAALTSGDSFLRLRGPTGTEVASNDDGCGSGYGSKISYTASVAGTYEVRAGCYQAGSCAGTVAWEIVSGGTTTPASGTQAFNVSDTANATRNTQNANVDIAPGQTLTFGSCGVGSATGTGDTVVRLFNAAGQQVTFNDDASGCGSLSRASYTAPASAGGAYQIRVGCFGSEACSGTLAWTLQ
ncbi:trypsin-like serine protease [Corallococcus exiguus]|uniref:serine protease n=1 Tax=Corallococcus TaxID=83461 RepID=UPI000EA1E7BC|nr:MULTISPECIES: serine protease [Corallococcus]NNC19033.1 trypsin-like serine protease [Corallococcus exiguus]NRD56936.1 trypsin-like peptidase domain-containing protein [Corallococcus exiguus]RKH30810.1 serine protease [Corallococcus sp. CA041A]RKI14842.1 serine protease [Corallococcus sp. AB030]RUO91089.1 serine protease [Corallococcus sp. AB018]